MPRTWWRPQRPVAVPCQKGLHAPMGEPAEVHSKPHQSTRRALDVGVSRVGDPQGQSQPRLCLAYGTHQVCTQQLPAPHPNYSHRAHAPSSDKRTPTTPLQCRPYLLHASPHMSTTGAFFSRNTWYLSAGMCARGRGGRGHGRTHGRKDVVVVARKCICIFIGPVKRD
jgi:hypothetical protein